MEPIEDVDFIKGDIFDKSMTSLISAMSSSGFSTLLWYIRSPKISDLSPNISGEHIVDYRNSCLLLDRVLDSYLACLTKDGNFVYKFFDGDKSNGTFCFLKESSDYKKRLQDIFKRCKVFKPRASRSESSEFYYVCIGKLK